MSSNAEDRFYLSAWTPKDDSEIRYLMEREGADDGGDAIVAEFSRYPAPLGEQLAAAALATANAFEGA